LAASCGGGGTPAPSPVIVPPPAPAPLQTIAELTAGRVGTGVGNVALPIGQSVQVLQGPFASIRFSWQRYVGFSPGPSASGSLYIFSQEYQGPIRGLSPSAPGFVAVSTSVQDEEYVFSDAVTLQPGTTYWFYSSDQTAVILSTDNRQESLYPGGDMYVSNGERFVVFYPFGEGRGRVDANFVLRGRPVTAR
jgi:hypothetical protein